MTKLPNKTSLAEQKSLLRAEIRRLKKLQLPDDLQAWSAAICEKVMALPEWQSARTVLLYAALPDEVQTLSLQEEALACGKRLLLPVVQGDQLNLRFYTHQTPMCKGSFNIDEPQGEDFLHYETIDLAIIPAMAYDREGHRLGRGKGYYDRLLPHLQCPLVGIVYPFQVLEKIPAETWDIPVRRVITIG